MFRRVIFPLVVCLFAGATALCAETTVFGPRTFVLATGAPQTFDVTIPLDLSDNCDGRAVYILSIKNGDGTATHEITSARVSLNGAEILGTSAFKNRFQTFERQFQPLTSNMLSITLSGGQPGSLLTVSVRKLIEEAIFQKEYALTSKSGDFSDQFAATDLSGSYVIVIRSGADDGTHMPKNISTLLNGTEVPLTGAITRQAIPLQALNTVAVSLRGDPGDMASVEVHRSGDESLCSSVAIAITSPADGAVLNTRPLLVRGTASGGADLGVTLNGMPVRLDTTHAGTKRDPYPWIVALNVIAGPLTLDAAAVTPNGSNAHAAVDVTFAPVQDQLVEIAAFPSYGTAPLDVQFLIAAKTRRPIVRCELDLDGDGTYETVLPSLSDYPAAHYEQPGLREVKVRATDDTGKVMTSSTIVSVDSFAAVDTIIQSRWRSFVGFLAKGDIDHALELFAGDKEREKYRAALHLIAPSLPQFAADIAVIRPVYVRGDVAYYLLTRTIDGVIRGYPIYFARGNDGLWKLVQF